MTKLVQNDIASLTNEQSALAALNANYNSLELFSDTVLSRDGTTPNQMNADLDMNSHRILNIGDPLDMNHASIIGLDDGVALTEPVTVNQLNNAIFSGGGASAALPFVTSWQIQLHLSAERALAAGTGVTLTDGGANSTVTIGLDGDLQAVAGLSTTGLVTRTATDTMTTRTLTQPAAGITITNPAGLAGNPTSRTSKRSRCGRRFKPAQVSHDEQGQTLGLRWRDGRRLRGRHRANHPDRPRCVDWPSYCCN
jgi:hypothetical protein